MSQGRSEQNILTLAQRYQRFLTQFRRMSLKCVLSRFCKLNYDMYSLTANVNHEFIPLFTLRGQEIGQDKMGIES